jgi:hypothetical protein
VFRTGSSDDGGDADVEDDDALVSSAGSSVVDRLASDRSSDHGGEDLRSDAASSRGGDAPMDGDGLPVEPAVAGADGADCPGGAASDDSSEVRMSDIERLCEDYEGSIDVSDECVDEGESTDDDLSTEEDVEVIDAVRGAAELVARVPGGVIRHYAATASKPSYMVAHCGRHGPKCRLTRTCGPSPRMNKAAQGRPLGLLLAWLRRSFEGAIPACQHDHVHMETPSFVDREHSRNDARDCPDLAGFWVKERPRRLETEPSDEPVLAP